MCWRQLQSQRRARCFVKYFFITLLFSLATLVPLLLKRRLDQTRPDSESFHSHHSVSLGPGALLSQKVQFCPEDVAMGSCDGLIEPAPKTWFRQDSFFFFTAKLDVSVMKFACACKQSRTWLELFPEVKEQTYHTYCLGQFQNLKSWDDFFFTSI